MSKSAFYWSLAVLLNSCVAGCASGASTGRPPCSADEIQSALDCQRNVLETCVAASNESGRDECSSFNVAENLFKCLGDCRLPTPGKP